MTPFLFYNALCVIFIGMHPFLIRFLSEQQKKRTPHSERVSEYALLREFDRVKTRSKQLATSIMLMIFGVCSAATGLLGFLLPSHLIDGGAVGIALLTAAVTGWPFSILFALISMPFILMAYRAIGPGFAARAAFSIITLAIVVELVSIPMITEDRLLVAVFGGFFLGLGIGLVMRGGGVLDGTEVMAIMVTRRLSLTVGDMILIINVIIFSVAAWMLSIETALYSMLTYLAASRTVDFILEGIEEYTAVTIISPRSEEIRVMITEKLGRGVTIYKGKRGFGTHGHRQSDVDIIFTVITRLEVNRLTSEIQLIDKSAFVVMQSVKDTRGGMIKKRAHKHE